MWNIQSVVAWRNKFIWHNEADRSIVKILIESNENNRIEFKTIEIELNEMLSWKCVFFFRDNKYYILLTLTHTHIQNNRTSKLISRKYLFWTKAHHNISANGFFFICTQRAAWIYILCESYSVSVVFIFI